MKTGWNALRRPSAHASGVALALLVGTAVLGVAGAAAAAPSPGALPPLKVPAPVAELSTLDLGMYLNLSVNASQVSGGSGQPANWAYTWLGLPTNCTSANVTNYSCVPSVTGTFSVSVKVTDNGSGTNATSPSVTVTVNPDPTVTSFTASAASVAVGGDLTFTTVAAGGTGALTYVYEGLPAGCTGNQSTVTCHPTVSQIYNVSVYVVDTLGIASAGPASVNVTVTGTSSGSSATTPTVVEWAVIAVILIVGLGVSAALWVRAGREERRSYGRRPPPRPAGTPPENAAPGPGAAPPRR